MEYLLVKLLVAFKVSVLKSNLFVTEQHEVVDENLGCLFESFLRMYGTIRCHFDNELVVVGLLLNTIWLHSEFDVTDRCVNRIDRNYVNVCAELTVLISGDIATSLVNRKVYLH